MNYIDLAILAIIIVSAIGGIYQGFIVAALNIAASFVSWLSAWIFYPKLAQYLNNRFHLLNSIMYYAEGSSKITSAKLLHAAPSSVDASTIQAILEPHNLPPFMNKLLVENAKAEVFAQLKVNDLGQYFDTMFGIVILNILSFVALLLIIRIIAGIAVSIARNIVDLPVLKRFDSLAGLILGVMRGLFIVIVIFALLDAAALIIPSDFLLDTINSSALARFFYNHNIITSVIRIMSF